MTTPEEKINYALSLVEEIRKNIGEPEHDDEDADVWAYMEVWESPIIIAAFRLVLAYLESHEDYGEPEVEPHLHAFLALLPEPPKGDLLPSP